MVKLIIETEESEKEKDFNYKTEQWEETEAGMKYYFTIVADTKEEAESIYDAIHENFICSLCPNHEKTNSGYDDKYTIEDITEKKIDKRKLKKYL